MEESSILVRQSGEVGIIQIHGRGSFQNASHIKFFTQNAKSLGIHLFAFDLQHCTHMDSTFMGTMAGLAIELKQHNHPPPELYNISSRNLELLQTLGLDRLLVIKKDLVDLSADHFQELKPSGRTPGKEEVSRDMLKAHEALIKVDKQNASKFEDVIHFLREKLGIETI